MHSILRDFLHKYLQMRTSGLVTETDVFFFLYSLYGNLAKGAETLSPQFNFTLSDQKVDADFS